MKNSEKNNEIKRLSGLVSMLHKEYDKMMEGMHFLAQNIPEGAVVDSDFRKYLHQTISHISRKATTH